MVQALLTLSFLVEAPEGTSRHFTYNRSTNQHITNTTITTFSEQESSDNSDDGQPSKEDGTLRTKETYFQACSMNRQS